MHHAADRHAESSIRAPPHRRGAGQPKAPSASRRKSAASSPGATAAAKLIACMTDSLPPLVAPWRIGVDVGGTFTDMVLRDAKGEVRIFTLRHAIENAQALVRQYLSEGRSLSEELIAERREAAAHE